MAHFLSFGADVVVFVVVVIIMGLLLLMLIGCRLQPVAVMVMSLFKIRSVYISLPAPR